MKKHINLVTIIFAMSFVLIACSDDNEKTSETINDSSSNTENEESNEIEQKEGTENDDEENDSDGSDWGSDEIGLKIGDTGTVHNNFSETERTLDSVEFVDDEGYPESEYGHYLVAHMTIKNIGDEPVETEEVIYSTEMFYDDYGAELSVEVEDLTKGWPDEIDVDEEASGTIVFEVREANTYEMKIGEGLSSVSNKVSFEFDNDEIE